MMKHWTSPDNKIKKEVLTPGKSGDKPSEWCQCTITITESTQLPNLTNKTVIIGDSDGEIWRAIDIGLTTMCEKERAKFIINLNGTIVSLILELHNFKSNGLIYEWDASRKYEMAMHHKDKGKECFLQNNNKDAAFRFTKALKIILSVPIDVESPPEVIDGITVKNINCLKATLFNNLATCYFKNQQWSMVIDLCNKVLSYDKDNVKALYKIGVAYENDRNFEKAYEALTKALKLDPDNRASAEHLACVKEELKKAESRVNNMMKKMFVGALHN
ncbi:unnamed protein product [Callosobruchus maculatus]|uniref:Uncharacterized protein n=1 Tax=Callosobruchus maculatus TaxID=64391 RepID=A0A653DBA7_CALMS|nr:unnamed protein product [Callosobruchus maculatus]